MEKVKALTMNRMAKRISERDDNIFDKRVIANILDMYMDECRKALLSGEKVQISKVGTIIPEVKARISYSLPNCNKDGGNPPYTTFKISRNYHMKEEMDRRLIQNIKKGIYGLEKLPLSKPQLSILKNSGYIPEDVKIIEREE